MHMQVVGLGNIVPLPAPINNNNNQALSH